MEGALQMNLQLLLETTTTKQNTHPQKKKKKKKKKRRKKERKRNAKRHTRPLCCGGEEERREVGAERTHTPTASLSGTRLPISAIIGYDTEGALFISAHLSTDAVSVRVWVPIRLKVTQRRSTHVNMRRARTGYFFFNEFRLSSNDFCFTFAGISNVDSYKSTAWYDLNCLFQLTAIWYARAAPTGKKSELADSVRRPVAYNQLWQEVGGRMP